MARFVAADDGTLVNVDHVERVSIFKSALKGLEDRPWCVDAVFTRGSSRVVARFATRLEADEWAHDRFVASDRVSA